MYAAAAYFSELVGAGKLPKTKKRTLDFVNNLLEKRNVKKKHKIDWEKNKTSRERDSTL